MSEASDRIISDTDYDVIVVGSGLGGVSVAAIVAKAGFKVLVLEQGVGFGGLAHGFERNGCKIDSAIRIMAEAEMVVGLLEFLGVADECELRPIDHLYQAEFPGMSIFAPAGLDAFMQAHIEKFPDEEEGIRRFFGLRRQMFLELASMPMRVNDARVMDRLFEIVPTLMRYRTSTLKDVMDEHLRDPRLKAACSVLWPYMGAPPSQLSFFAYSQFLGVLVDGPYYCMGGFQRMVDAFLTALRRNGGAAIDQAPVARILVENGAVTGVETDDGTRYAARAVISNADAHQTFGQLIGHEHLPQRFIKRMNRMTPSLSAFCVYAATSQDVTEHLRAHETFKYSHWDHEDTWREVLDGGRPAGMSLSVMTMMDPSLAPAGQHLLIGTAVAPFVRGDGKKWGDEKDRFADALLGEFETLCPGLRENLSFCQAGSPVTIERFTRNHQGATYGWALSPNQIGTKRLAHDTPIGGLFLSGHWTEEGPASFRVVLSGMNTSRMVLASLGSDMEVPTFKPDDVPQAAL